MRKLLGSLLLIAGVGGLGYVGTTQNAPHIQAAIAADAQAAGQSGVHGLQTQVWGRDVVVTGLVSDQTELAALRATFESIDGVRVVDLSGVETLPIADPYAISAVRLADGSISLTGVMPSDADRNILMELAQGADADLTLAAGMPDDKWPAVAGQAITALSGLITGELTLTGRSISLRGLAQDPGQRDAALAEVESLPDGYVQDAQIDVVDDGLPLRLTLTLRDGGIYGSGKLPSDMAETDIIDRFEIGEPLEINQAVIAADDPDWPDAARISMDALSRLMDAQLNIEGQGISLAGVGSPDGRKQAEALLATLPDDYAVSFDIGLWDSGTALSMTMEWDGTTATASGKFPDAFTPRGPAGVAVESDAEISFLADEAGSFSSNADAGVAALGLLSEGRLVVTESSISLIGTATTPQVGVVMDSVLAGLADTTEVTREISYLDDGSPAAWTLTYRAADGANVEGRLPDGLTVGDIDLALGVDVVTGTPATALADDDVGSSLETLGIVAEYLPEIENLTYAREGGGSALDLTLSPGVDLDLVAGDLAARLPTDVAFSLSPLENLPEEGTVRTNVSTGMAEVFSGGFWLPEMSFEASVPECEAQTLNVFERGQVGFLSASARLDATSIRTINALSAVVLPCVAAGLTLEVGGHTDATGTELANEVLSQNRADAVRQALLQRGVPAQAMTAFGFGQSQPIQDNDTPEGRTANRRTDITWFAPGALRDP